MEIITSLGEINGIVNSERLKFGGFRVFNTPWAKDKHGNRDIVNVALFVELVNERGIKHYWLISEDEVEGVNRNFSEVKSYNMRYNHQGKEYKDQLELDL